MKKTILITDSLFIFPEHEEILVSKGFDVERLDKPAASEEELCDAIRGKHGYILGGIEQVTSNVIDAADSLEAISFTGSGYAEFIPAHASATQKGIAISAAIGGNASAVAEYTIALLLSMARRIPMMTAKGGASFYVAPSLQELTLGIVGFGHIGKKVAQLAEQLGIKVIAYSRTDFGNDAGVQLVSLDDLLKQSDVISLHVSKTHGTNVFGVEELGKMKDGAILLNTAFPHAVDATALHAELLKKRILSAFDAPAEGDFSDVPIGYYIASNSQTAFNTGGANKTISDRVTNSIVNLLSTGDDTDLVNPEYRTFRNKS
ncbi:MAG: hypothetical protein IPN69_06955 [Acidobacteria bacterium]|nr:hypothetical protein [Acidobacteriota bacterium]